MCHIRHFNFIFKFFINNTINEYNKYINICFYICIKIKSLDICLVFYKFIVQSSITIKFKLYSKILIFGLEVPTNINERTKKKNKKCLNKYIKNNRVKSY